MMSRWFRFAFPILLAVGVGVGVGVPQLGAAEIDQAAPHHRFRGPS